MLAVHHDDKARLFAVQELFHDDAVSGVAKRIASQHIAHRRFRFLQRHGDDNAFARRRAVCFNDDRRAFGMHILQRQLDVGKVLIFSRRDFMTRRNLW